MENLNAEYFRKKYASKKDLTAHYKNIFNSIDSDLSRGKSSTCYYCDGSDFEDLSEYLIKEGFKVKDVSSTKNIRKEGYKAMEISL